MYDVYHFPACFRPSGLTNIAISLTVNANLIACAFEVEYTVAVFARKWKSKDRERRILDRTSMLERHVGVNICYSVSSIVSTFDKLLFKMRNTVYQTKIFTNNLAFFNVLFAHSLGIVMFGCWKLMHLMHQFIERASSYLEGVCYDTDLNNI